MVVAMNPRRYDVRKDKSPHWTELPEGTTRVCTKCGIEYPFTSEFFEKEKRRGSGLGPRCKSCANKYSREYYNEHWGRVQCARRAGISIEEYNEMWARQNGLCAICGKPDDRLLAVDHNHESGKTRGLLCTKCNPMIGFAQESIDVLFSAIEYLQLHEGDD